VRAGLVNQKAMVGNSGGQADCPPYQMMCQC